MADLANSISHIKKGKAEAAEMGTPAVSSASGDHVVLIGEETSKTEGELQSEQAMREKAAAEQQAEAVRTALRYLQKGEAGAEGGEGEARATE